MMIVFGQHPFLKNARCIPHQGEYLSLYGGNKYIIKNQSDRTLWVDDNKKFNEPADYKKI
jgi:hypothetical protein